MSGSAPLELREDRFFDSDPTVRAIARALFNSVKELPIYCPHGHVDATMFVENRPFANPAELLIIPDHYVLRMLYSQGIPLESLGVRPLDGSYYETDARKIWKIFAENYHLFRGTPTGIWINHVLSGVFGIRKRLCGATALEVFEEIDAKLRLPAFSPRSLFERFNIAVLTGTDAATDDLENYRSIRASGWKGNIIPCFRPDGLTDLKARDWRANIELLGNRTGMEINSFRQFIRALENRREFFRSMGTVSTDHGVRSPFTRELTEGEAERIFLRALKGSVTNNEAALFTAHMLMEMARMSVEDSMVMQIHPGVERNHNRFIYERFGANKGSDIPIASDYTNNLRDLLNKYGNDPRFTLIVFTLDESTYSRELAPLAGHYPAMKLGPPWWFHDSLEGMMRYRLAITETAGIHNTVGFNDDARSLVSIPARHDLARRVDSNFLAGLVARHIIEMDEAHQMSYDLANGLVKKAYKL